MTLPLQMLACEISKDAFLLPVQRPLPMLDNGQILIQVFAAGVNYADVMQRKGLYPPPVGVSDIPGLEVAGIIVAVAENVATWHVGDKVCALVSGGGYAQYCAAEAGTVLPIPDGLDFIQAAALPEALFTVWSNLFERAQLKSGETLLIHGGSSGIGTTAIQLAKAFGVKVLITAGTEQKCQFCTQLGAAAAINYRTEDFVTACNKFTQGRGVDVILDIVGGDYFPRNIKCLATEGRLVQIAVQNGIKSEINLLSLMQKRLTITGSTLRARDAGFKAKTAQQLQTQVWSLVASRQIKPVIHATFPLAQAQQAHQLMESRQHIGKIVLTVA